MGTRRAGTGEEGKPGSAAVELESVRKRLLECTSISATVVETIALGDKGFKAEGRYLQKSISRPSEWHMRMELVVKIGETQGSLLEVCDGEVLWTRTELDFGKKTTRDRKDQKESTITRRNIAEIMSAARKLGDVTTETALIANFGLGGLPALIASIEQNMKISPDMEEKSLRERPVVVIQGTWSDAFAMKLRGPSPATGAAPLLPAFVPDSVRIYVDRETGFPHRIMYSKKLPGREVHKPMVTLDFLDVELNQPIDNSEFEYQAPEGVTPIEQTKFYVDMLTPPTDPKSQAPAPGR